MFGYKKDLFWQGILHRDFFRENESFLKLSLVAIAKTLAQLGRCY